MFYYNDVADRTARQANQDRPSSFWDVWEAHVQAVGASETVYQQVRELHLAVGRRQVQCHVSADSGDHVPGPVRQTREFAPSFTRGGWDGCLLPRVSRLYGSTVMQKISQWFLGRLADKADLVWVSFAQLYLDFQIAVGHPGPLRVNGQWVDAEQRPYLTVETFTFKQRTKWFRLCLKHLWKEAGVSVGMEQCRPTSTAITAFLPSASLPWDAHSLAVVDDWLGKHLPDPCARAAGALNGLPLPPMSGSGQKRPR